jgi:transposase InsO family protein
MRAVDHVRYEVLDGSRREKIADALGISPRTMRDWEQLEREGDLRPRRRGRPPRRSSLGERSALLGAIRKHGPGIGVAALRHLIPGLGREEVRHLLARYRAHYVREHAVVLEMLEWIRPGVVWALDHTESDDGRNQTILSVRDLSSGAQLLWRIQAGPRASDTVQDLERLFVVHGPPLVLKADNGSAFIAGDFQDLCEAWGVEILWSPPRQARYNGAIEASIRWMKERTAHVASRAGRPGEWRTEDVCEALELSNQLSKDAERERTPRWEVFCARRRVGDEEREVFGFRLEAERAAARRAMGIAPETRLGRNGRAQIQRHSMRRALVALGYLTITSRRVPLTLKALLAARIS